MAEHCSGQKICFMIRTQAVPRSSVISLQEEGLLPFLLALRFRSILGDFSLQISKLEWTGAS